VAVARRRNRLLTNAAATFILSVPKYVRNLASIPRFIKKRDQTLQPGAATDSIVTPPVNLFFRSRAMNRDETKVPLFLFALTLFLTSPTMSPAATLFVSPDGRPGWSGSIEKPNPQQTDGPLPSLVAARDRVRALRAAGDKEPMTVLVRGGTYRLSEPFVLEAEDSGTPAAPVTYAAYAGESPILSGGQTITGWRQGTDGTWSATVPGVKEGQWSFHQLFVGGQRRQRARTPNVGFFQVDGVISPDNAATFHYRAGDIRPEWATQGNVEVIDLNKWQMFRMPIRAINAQTRTVTLSTKRSGNSVEPDSRYWIENTKDALDAPGEWYLDKGEGVVYYRPLSGEDLSRVEVLASRLERLVVLRGEPSEGRFVHDLTLRGLTLSYTDWSLPSEGYAGIQADADLPTAAIEATAARRCGIEQCTFAHLGQHALALGKGSKENRIVGNRFTDIGAVAIKIGDPLCGVYPNRKAAARSSEYRYPLDPKDYSGRVNYPKNEAETCSGNLVSDNRVDDVGVIYPSAVGIWVGQCNGNTIAHNEIHDTPYSGISCGWTWGFGPTAARDNIVEYNHIYNIGRGLMSDMGGIYILGTQPGTEVRNNLIHDIHRYSGKAGYGGWGIYLDSATSQVRVEKNVIYGTDDAAIHHNQGQENTIVNNILALGKNAQIQRSNKAPKRSFTFERNIVYYKTGDLFRTLLTAGQFSFDHNLYYNAAGEPVEFGRSISGRISWEAWQSKGQDAHSIIADPLFVDPEHSNFQLKPDSPAFKLGFQAIDLSTVGPREQAGPLTSTRAGRAQSQSAAK
jgi:hypothetical protein